jgi:DNA modification methylase
VGSEILQGDCIERMAEMDEASVDAIVTDPPYGLEFMGKEWDRLDRIGFHQGEPQMFAEGGSVSLPATPKLSQGKGKRCDDCGKYAGGNPKINCTCDEPRFRNVSRGAEQEAWHLHWVTEAFRVLKPGGHLLAFGGTRTYHRLACAVEDAGFEIRDSLIWLYGSGFPKSLDVSKAIDKSAGAEREDVYEDKPREMDNEVYGKGLGVGVLQRNPATPEAQQWQGWGTALKPAHEPIVVARKPLVGTVAANVLEHGTGAINVDGCRIGLADGEQPYEYPHGKGGDNGPVSFIPRNDFNDKPLSGNPAGRWPANVALSHLPECEMVGTRSVKRDLQRLDGSFSFAGGGGANETGKRVEHTDSTETFSAYSCAPGCPVAELDRQSGELAKQGAPKIKDTADSAMFGGGSPDGFYGDTGGASRFFYVAKASRAERNAGLDGFEERARYKKGGVGGTGGWRDVEKAQNAPPDRNHHPTVKPIDLMRWLVRLVTPPNGTILDPFTGSGTTGIAATLEGFDFIGIEREAEYAEIARARIEHWQKYPQGSGTKAALKAEAKERKRKAKEVQDGLF